MKNRRLASLVPAAIVAALVLFSSLRAGAEEFSFYGVRFGMTQEEVGSVWLPLSDGVYAVSTESVSQVTPIFDHEGRLYELSFAVILPTDYPTLMVRTAFQQEINEKWGKAGAGLDTRLVIGPGGTTVTVRDQKRHTAYISHIQVKIAPLLQP